MEEVICSPVGGILRSSVYSSFNITLTSIIMVRTMGCIAGGNYQSNIHERPHMPPYILLTSIIFKDLILSVYVLNLYFECLFPNYETNLSYFNLQKKYATDMAF